MNENIIKIKNNISKKRLEELITDLVGFKSEAPPGNEYEACIYLKELLQSIGFTVKMQEAAPNRFNVIGILNGTNRTGKTLMYNGHIDVVPAGEENLWSAPPFSCTKVGNKIYGRGTSDMKGSIVSFIHAVEAVKNAGLELEGNVIVALDVDEEVTNLGLKKMIQEGFPRADYCIVGEPTNLEIAIGHRGVMAFEVEVFGRSVHAAQASNGINAIYQAKKLIEEIMLLDERLKAKADPLLGRPTINVTTISGGIKVNVLPESCKIMIDRRLVPGENRESCERELQDIINSLKLKDDYFRCNYRITTYCPPGAISKEEKIVQGLKKAIKLATGEEAIIKGFEATCEASLIMENANMPTVIFGPGSIAQAHNTDEYIEIQQLVKGSEIFATLLVTILNERSTSIDI